jgi:hypothetical protein
MSMCLHHLSPVHRGCLAVMDNPSALGRAIGSLAQEPATLRTPLCDSEVAEAVHALLMPSHSPVMLSYLLGELSPTTGISLNGVSISGTDTGSQMPHRVLEAEYQVSLQRRLRLLLLMPCTTLTYKRYNRGAVSRRPGLPNIRSKETSKRKGKFQAIESVRRCFYRALTFFAAVCSVM